MKNRILTLLLATAFSTGASAAIVSVDAGNYTFSYDDSFWGVGTFSRSGDVFTFSNLAGRFGTSATISSDLPAAQKSFNYKVTSGSPAISISIDNGYHIQSITSAAAGSVTAGAGSHLSNTSGSSASAHVGAETSWYESGSGIGLDEVANNRHYAESRDSLGNLTNQSGSYGYFDIGSPSGPFSDVTSVYALYTAFGSVEASGKGAWANAYQDIARFEVNVLPVPEPETWAMFLAGLGIMGVVARRRRHLQG